MVDIDAARFELERLSKIASDPRVLTRVIFGLELEPAPILLRVATDRDVERSVLEGARRWIEGLDELSLLEYDLGHRIESTELAAMEVADEPLAGGLQDALSRIDALSDFEDTEVLNKVKFVVTALTDRTGEVAALVKRVTPGRFILREGKMHRIVFRNRTFTSIEEDVVQFDDDYHLAIADDHLFVANQHQFEALFDYRAQHTQMAERTARAIAASLPVSDEELFVEALCSDRRYLRKLESARRRDLLRARTPADIEAFCVAQSIGLSFMDGADGRRTLLVVNSVEWRRAVLALLDDDNLSSSLSGADYEANSKRTRRQDPLHG